MEYSTRELFFALLRSEIAFVSLSEEQKAGFTPEKLKEIYVLAKKHDLAHIAASALQKAGLLEKGSSVEAAFSKYLMLAVFRCEGFLHELEQIKQVFEAEGIDFILLKGSTLRALYPEPWMRTSCDMDILVHYNDTEKAELVLQQKLQYTLVGRTGHDVSLKAPGGSVAEIHFDLIEGDRESRRSIAAVLAEVWQYAVPVASGRHEHKLQDEMEYFYHIAHMVKHFEGGGCGVRSFADLWLLNGKNKENGMLRAKILEDGKIKKFADGAQALAEVWFSGSEHTAFTCDMEEYILSGGVYGNADNRISVSQEKRGGKLKYMCARLFLPMSVLREIFPVLKKHPYLMPFCQVWRWIKAVKEGRGKKAAYEMGKNLSISKDELRKGAELRKKLGL